LIQIVLYLALAVFAMELFAFGVIGPDGITNTMEIAKMPLHLPSSYLGHPLSAVLKPMHPKKAR
ncbi:hypothetical protein, partial [Klebsiella pneumoniae]|uniref:hypothetical protein n=1 Tax=Klebsiella pneumoniae TaxID=573 RepID=UPI001C9A734C